MIDLKELTEEKERLTKILSGDVIITPKYFGNSIIADFTEEGNHKYFKKNKEPITIIDILVSYFYSEPMTYLIHNTDCFENKIYHFTNNYKTGKLVLDARDYCFPNNFPEDDIFVTSQSLFEGKLSTNQKSMFKKNNVDKILKEFDVDDDITTIFIRSADNPKDAFKISTNIETNIHIPSDMFNIIMVDVIRSVKIESLKKMMVESSKWDEIYVSMIDKIFLKYLDISKYDLTSIDLGYPEHMKVDPHDKVEWLSHDVENMVCSDVRLYDLYVMLLTSFRKKQQKGNTHMTDKTNEKYTKIHNTMKSLYENAGINISIPSYFEHSNK